MGRTSMAVPGLVSWSSSWAMASAPSRSSASIRIRPARYSLLSMNGPSVSSSRPSSLRSVVADSSAWSRARLAYLSLIDFVPGHEPYEHLTAIDIEPAGDRTTVVMTVDPLHDETWTQGYRAHRGNELDNLDAVIRRRTT
jgi:hypothetical protein